MLCNEKRFCNNIVYGKLICSHVFRKDECLDSGYGICYKYSHIKLTELNENPSKMWFKLCTFKMNKLFVMCGQTMLHVKCLFSEMFGVMVLFKIHKNIYLFFVFHPCLIRSKLNFNPLHLIRILWLNGITINLNGNQKYRRRESSDLLVCYVL